MLNLIPAIQLFTLREHTQTPEGFEMCVRRVREMGCNNIQISRIGPSIPADFITGVLKEYDMNVCVTHTPMARIFNDLSAVIREHHNWGCNSVGLGNLENHYLDDGYEGYCRFIKDIAPIVAELKANGMTFAYHSHTFEFVKYHGKTMYDMMIDETDPEAFHFIQDSFWMKYGGLDHAHYMRRVAGRMEVLHVKDFTTKITTLGELHGDTGTIGEGNIDYRHLLKVAEETGVKVLPIEQDHCDRDPFDCLFDAFSALKQILAENDTEGGDNK